MRASEFINEGKGKKRKLRHAAYGPGPYGGYGYYAGYSGNGGDAGDGGVGENFDDASPHTSYVQSNRTVTSHDGKDQLSDRTASLSTDRSGNQRVRAVDGDELTINTDIPKGVRAKMVPQQGDADIDEGSVQDNMKSGHKK